MCILDLDITMTNEGKYSDEHDHPLFLNAFVPRWLALSYCTAQERRRLSRLLPDLPTPEFCSQTTDSRGKEDFLSPQRTPLTCVCSVYRRLWDLWHPNLFLPDSPPLLSCYTLAADGFLTPRFTEIVFFVTGSVESQCVK